MSFSSLRNAAAKDFHIQGTPVWDSASRKYHALRIVPYNLAEDFIDTIKFSRRSDFYKAWPDWEATVCRYFSSDVGFFMDVLKHRNNRFYTYYALEGPNGVAFDHASAFASNITYWERFGIKSFKTILSEIKHCNRLYHPGNFNLRDAFQCCDCFEKFFQAYYYSETNAELVDYYNPFPYSECRDQNLHMLNIYIPMIMAMIKKSKRSLKRYYWKIIRMLYSMDPTRIVWDDVERLIFSPPDVVPRNVLTYVYNNHYFEKFTKETQDNILYFVESNKYFRESPVQQGGTCQSVSATMFDELAEIYKQYNDIYQQGWGLTNFRMTHTIAEEERELLFSKFESSLLRTQNEFMNSLKGSLTEIGHYALSLFIIVATTALLGYTLVRLGERVVFGTLNLIYKLLCGDLFSNDAIQQSGEGISIPLLPAMIIKNVISPPTELLTKMWNNPQVDRTMRRLGYIGDPKIHRGIASLTEWMRDMVTMTINWFSRDILGLAVPEDITHTCSPVEKWYEECDGFMKSYWDQTMQWNDSTWSVLMNLYGKGTSLARQKVFEGFKSDIYKILFKLSNILEKFNARGRSGNSVRNPPVTIYMAGGTGVGKSSVTYPLAAEILKGIFQKEKSNIDLKKHWKSLIYMRSSEQEYWDGYENQLVTVFDDFNQMVDSAGNPNVELFEVIRASNSFPYPLHMAALDQKATTTFSSKIILVSSNLEQPKSVSLNFPEALWRRFDLSIKVTRKNGVVVEPGKFDPNIYNFQRFDMTTQTAGDFMSYKEVIYYAVTEYFKRKGFVDSIDSYISNTLADVPDPQPVQQGLGTFAGNCVCAGKMWVKTAINCIHDEYVGFCSALSPNFCYREMFSLQNSLDKFKEKLGAIAEKWRNFKNDHPYMAKVLQFLSISTLVFGIIRVLMSFMDKGKKEKLMSMEQFVKGGKELPEVCDSEDVKKLVRLSGEGYVQPNVKALKVEGYVPPRLSVLKVESYTQAREKQLKAEGVLFQNMCPHQYASEDENLHNLTLLRPCSDDCPNQLKSEGVKDVNAHEIMGKLLTRSFYKLYMAHNDEPIGHGLFIRGRIFLCPHHYINVLKKLAKIGGNIFFKNKFLKRSFMISAKEIVESYKTLDSPDEEKGFCESRDLMAFPVRSATIHSNIEPYFVTRNGLAFVMRSEVMLPVVVDKDGDLPYIGFHFTTGRTGLTIKEKAIIKDDDGNDVRMIRDLWEYSMDTKATYCGAPLIVRNPQISPGKIIGLHVAGIPNTGLGFSTPLYKEDINRILSMFPTFDTVEFRPETKLEEFPIEQAQVPKDAEFIRMGSVPRSVAQPGKSKIVPSPLYNKIREPKTRPCALRPVMVEGKEFDPRQYRLNRLGNYPVHIDNKLIHHAKRAVIDELASQIPRVTLGDNIKPVYTFEEAVVGIDGEPYINSIKRNTSPGYPYVHMAGFSNRKEIFGDDEKCDLNRPQSLILQHRVKRIVELAGKGVALDHIFMDTLKDERKPIHKAHKTRLFSAGPIDYLIACKQYFNGIVAVLQKSRNICHVSVGTDHNTQDWSMIARELLRKSDHMIAGDFEGFDASQSMPLLEAAGDILIALSEKFCETSQEDAKIMKVLLVGLFNSTHVTDKEVYQWTHSLPSGHYLTAIINSIFVLLVFCICWMLAREMETYMIARQFFQVCGIVAYGDDHIVSVPKRYLNVFNQLTIPDLMKTIGLGYTMEDKDRTADVISRPITEILYLKRAFVFDQELQRWIAPMTLDTILESPMWLHKCPDKVTQTITQLDAQLRELSLHDKLTWDKWASVFADLGKQFGHYTKYVYQGETRAEVLSE